MRYTTELHPEFLSNNANDPWVDVNSASRKAMFANHLSQTLVIKGSEERYWQTGVESRFGEFCFSVKAPADIEIVRIIDKYPKSRTIGTPIKNQQTIAIYVEIDTRRIGYLDLSEYCLEHQYFGFKYNKTDSYRKLCVGATFEKDTEFLISPSIKKGGGYAYGTNLVFAAMSHPAVSEDGILISESALKKLSYDIVESRTISWGQNRYALNLFGNESKYKIFKDIGETIRPDGLIMATRRFDENQIVTGMGLYDTMILDMAYDEKLYTRPGDGTVIDINVYSDNRSLQNGTNDQVMFYHNLTVNFYEEILQEYNNQIRQRKNKKILMTDEFHRLVVEACAMTDYDLGSVVQKLYHKEPVDDWKVEFKILYNMVPNIGNKLTGASGDKGVVCAVYPDEDMPVNDYGVRADVVMSPESPFNRQNFGGLYEPYFNQVTREFLTRSKEILRVRSEEKHTQESIMLNMKHNPEIYDKLWERLMRLYDILSPTMFDHYSSPEFDSDELRALHISNLFNHPCIHILSPTDAMTKWRQAVIDCEREFPPRISPVTYRGYSGKLVRTKKPIELGHKYFMLLEKISDDWIAVATAKIQHMGVLGQVTAADKYSAPAKAQAVKATSEAELRIITSYCSDKVAVELMDRNNSLATHRENVYNILNSYTPTNLERSVDRNRVPLGNNRALSLFKHIISCNGFKMVYKEYQDPDIHLRDQYVDKQREVLNP